MAMVYEIARRAGRRIRAANLGHDGPVTFETLCSVATAHGAEVYRTSLDPGQSGVIIKYAGSKPRIYISDMEAPERQLFTLAHELGHLIERRDLARDDEYGYVDHRNEGSSNLHEFYANEFAGELLMPAEQFVEVFDSQGEQEAARRFNVSVPAARERRRRLKVHSSDQL
ncbi:ImmA/IrrE family metallo-endopeptidase [Corynebacterium variabile]|uniref:ImmA/IrrE family metallo-endopeptidase n=1 Tax=Corynebacterium variabile TaxID=1727 RepID=UPI0028A057BF|nr:ImmA/IrrE family metallo-endopeptidase [Corynebacterium variabile]